MNNQTFDQMIASDEPILITPEFLDAARENAHQLRSRAMKQGTNWTYRSAVFAIQWIAPRKFVKQATAVAAGTSSELLADPVYQAQV